ncbi:MAG: hypothetical protein MZV70_53150 [Desulfobacterales bacterium]|nr:hypothetical protein [Desulfobacterales bacterium]
MKRMKSPEDLMKNHSSLSKEIARLAALEVNIKGTVTETVSTQGAGGGSGMSTFYIHFLPNETIFDNGTNPLFLIDELYALGTCEIIHGSIKFRNIRS